MAAEAKPNGEEPELDLSTLAAIRNLMVDEPEIDDEVVSAPVASPEPLVKTRRKADMFPQVADEATPEPEVAEPKALSRVKSAISTRVDAVKAQVLGYRPTAKHAIWVAFALLVVFRPWLVVATLLLTIFIIGGVFLTLGYDRFWQKSMALGHWYARRRPQRSARLHKKLDNFAMRWDAILDRFPEGTVDALYMPDFGELAAADARHDAAMERRLASMREG